MKRRMGKTDVTSCHFDDILCRGFASFMPAIRRSCGVTDSSESNKPLVSLGFRSSIVRMEMLRPVFVTPTGFTRNIRIRF